MTLSSVDRGRPLSARDPKSSCTRTPEVPDTFLREAKVCHELFLGDIVHEYFASPFPDVVVDSSFVVEHVLDVVVLYEVHAGE